MSKVFTVAVWEYVERVKSRLFLVSLILMPLIMLALGILPLILIGNGAAGTSVVAVADLTGKFLPRFADRLTGHEEPVAGEPTVVIRALTLPPSADVATTRSHGDQMVLSGEVSAFCLLRNSGDGRFEIEFRSASMSGLIGRGELENALRSLLIEDVLTGLGASQSSLDWLEKAVSVKRVVLSSSQRGVAENDLESFLRMFFSAYVFLMMLFFMILSSGQLLVRSVVEEKANRIVEILVSACSPTQLMAGKILGLSGLGLTQMLVWGGVALLVSAALGLDYAPPEHLILMFVYFVLGYLFYASIFVAAGSPVTTEHEAQQVTGYLVIFLVIPLVLTVPAIQDPGADWIVILSYIPLLTPTMMGLRLALGTVPSSAEILSTIALMLVAVYFCMIVAGRIFRIGILATGKRPGFREIVSWVREG